MWEELFFIGESVVLFILFMLGVAYYAKHTNANPELTSPSLPTLESRDADGGNIAQIVQQGGICPFLEQFHEMIGPVGSFWWKRHQILSVALPASWNEISQFLDRPNFFGMDRVIGSSNSILNLDGEQAVNRRRRVIDPVFSRSSAKAVVTRCLEPIAKSVVEEWTEISERIHLPIALGDQSLKVSLQTLSLLLLGRRFREEELSKFVEIFEEKWAEPDFWVGGEEPEMEDLDEGILNLRLILNDIVEERRRKCKTNPANAHANDNNNGRCWVDSILETADDNEMVLDETMNMMLFGVRSMAKLVAWTIAFVARNENELQALLREELRRVLQNRIIPCFEDIGKCTLLGSVIQETLRRTSIVSCAVRKTNATIKVAGHEISDGSNIIESIGSVLRDERVWIEPCKFDPMRFVDINAATSHTFVPFGVIGSKRACPAHKFVCNMVTVVTAAIIQSFEFELFNDTNELLNFDDPSFAFELQNVPFVEIKKR